MASAEDGTSKLDLDKTPMDERRRFTVEVTMLNRHAFRSFFGPEFANKCGNFVDTGMSPKVDEFGYWVDYPEGYPAPVIRLGKGVSSMAVSSGGRYLYTGNEGGLIQVWSLTDITQISEFVAGETPVNFLAYDSGMLVSNTSDGKIKVWNTNDSNRLMHTLDGKMYAIGDLGAYLEKSKTTPYIIGIEGRDFRIWSAMSGECVKSFAGDPANPITDAILWHSGLVCISGQSVTVWDTTVGEGKGAVLDEVGDNEFEGVTVNCDGTAIACWFSGEGGMIVYSWPFLEVLQRVRSPVYSARFHPILPTVLAVGDGPNREYGSDIYMVGLRNIVSSGSTLSFAGHNDKVTEMVFSTDGNRLIAGSPDGILRIWDVSLVFIL